MRQFALVHRQDSASEAIARQIRQRFEKEGIEENETHPDTVFVIGGDGTFLYGVHQYLDQLDRLDFIGIHTGTLGFMCDTQADELEELLENVLHKKPQIDKLKLLEIHTDEIPGKDSTVYALNEMRIENAVKTQILDIYIDGDFFETYRGTGICLATQMGSTAYNRSLKGAVIQHGLPLLELSEIAGIHHRAYQSLGNSIIFKEDTRLVFVSESFEGAILCWDHCSQQLTHAARIECFISDKSVRIARFKPYHYLERLKNLF